MKITRSSMYQVDVPLIEPEGFRLSGNREYYKLDSTILKVETDNGLVGWGEILPWGSNYTPAFARGARAGICELAPKVLGFDPMCLAELNNMMDFELVHNEYAKAAFDMACWDLNGKATGRPVYELLGGKQTDKPERYAFLKRETDDELLEQMEMHRANGMSHFGTKASDTAEGMINYINFVKEHMKPGESICLDFNRGLRYDEALRIARAAQGADIIMEQPCETIEECKRIAEVTGVPVMFDECITTVQDLIKAIGNDNITGLNLKIGRVGGLTKAKLLADICNAYKIPIYVQDLGGTDIATAALVHMAHAISPRLVGGIWEASEMVAIDTATGKPKFENGRIFVEDTPGLGIEAIPEVLGEPVAVWE